jgi:hypothetical protein
MKEAHVSNQLSMSWVEVVDETGRSRMEARWSVTTPTADAPVAVFAMTHAA